jgi:hypothetical protein
MAITAAFPNQAKLDALQLLCPSGSTYKCALYTSAAALSKATTAYTTTGEASGAGYTAGGATLTGYSAALDTDTAVLDFADPTWASSTITARGALIYNVTNANKAVAVVDFGADITSTNGTFTVTFPAATAAAGLVRIA